MLLPMLLSLTLLSCLLLGTTIVMGWRDWQTARHHDDHFSSTHDEISSPEQLTVEDLVPSSLQGTRLDRWLDRWVTETGLQLSSQVALLLSIVLGLLVGGAILLWQGNPLLALGGFVTGVLLAYVVLAWYYFRRRHVLQQQLPDAVMLLSRSVQAGQTLEQAITLVGHQSAPPLAAEFRQAALQLEIGLSVEGTMRAFTRRVPLDGAKIFSSTLIVQRQMGGNLPSTLQKLVQVLRERLNYLRQFRAVTVASRLSAIGIATFTLLLVFYLGIWQPEYLEQLTSRPTGQLLLVVAAVLYLVGLLWLFLLLRSRS